MVPKQRRPGGVGGSGHGNSRFLSIRRGGRPSSGRRAANNCLGIVLGAGIGISLLVCLIFSWYTSQK